MHKGVLVLVVVAFAFPAWGSQPGQRLTWNDWVTVLPSVVAEHFLGPQLDSACTSPGNLLCGVGDNFHNWTDGDHIGANGAFYYLGVEFFTCGMSSCGRYLLKRTLPDGTDQAVAYVEDRWVPTKQSVDDVNVDRSMISVDKTNGFVYVLFETVGVSYADGREIVRIRGLDTLFEVLQSYAPSTDAISFRVPAIPEGLHSADHFDTYWGHVSDLPDFTQAQPMQCHYPASAPTVGDYLTVADTSPVPSPGGANYIVTAVTSGTQRRYGRKLIAGVLSGRDPALLPGCP